MDKQVPYSKGAFLMAVVRRHAAGSSLIARLKEIADDKPDDPLFEGIVWGCIVPAYNQVGLHGLLNGEWEDKTYFDVTKILKDRNDPRRSVFIKVLSEMIRGPYHSFPWEEALKNSLQQERERFVWSDRSSDEVLEASRAYDKYQQDGWKLLRVDQNGRMGLSEKFNPSAQQFVAIRRW